MPLGVTIIVSLPSRYSSSFSAPIALDESWAKFCSLRSGNKISNFRRLARSTIYCIIASAYGLFMLFSTTTWPDDALLRFRSTDRLIFEAAIAHWMLSIVEDITVGNEICTSVSGGETKSVYTFFFGGLLMHHMFAIFAYTWCLISETLSGVCMFGLICEIPVVMLNLREIYILHFHHHESLWQKKDVNTYWIMLHILWHITRTSACLLYVISLIAWMGPLKSLLTHHSSFVVYNILGCGFTYINCVLLCTVIPLYTISDMGRTRSIPPSLDGPLCL
jgi:hypothetical protein